MVKCNVDGVVKGTPGPAACGGIFRGSDAEYLGSFSAFIGKIVVFEAELMGLSSQMKLQWIKDGLTFGCSVIHH